jgi:glucose-6-phosphate 1-dehydrogenase
MASRSVEVEPSDLVVFGAAGGLACRKLRPTLPRRATCDRFSEPTRVGGVSRRPFDREASSAASERPRLYAAGAWSPAASIARVERDRGAWNEEFE